MCGVRTALGVVHEDSLSSIIAEWEQIHTLVAGTGSRTHRGQVADDTLDAF